MNRLCLIVFCVFPAFIVGSEFGWSQDVFDVLNEFSRMYSNEFSSSQGQTQKWKEYHQLFGQLTLSDESIKTRSERVGKRFLERLETYATRPPEDEIEKILLEVKVDNSVDYDFEVQTLLADKMKELFPDSQKIQQRQFQVFEGIMRRLESLGSPDDILYTLRLMDNPPAFVNTLPDFLELTPEQIELIKTQQKETVLKARLLREENEQPEKIKEIYLWIEKSHKAKTPEEFREISQKLKEINRETAKGIAPQLNEILIQGRENFMRVLTDAQKAKIEAVMADMPDYMKNLFAAIDKQGGGLSILNNWQPGMGVPSVPNPNREAPRERSGSGGRAFPGK